MKAEKWADDAIKHIRRVEDAVKKVPSASQPQGAQTSQPQVIDKKELGTAIAEMLKTDNATTQAIAVRISNLADKYPNKAY